MQGKSSILSLFKFTAVLCMLVFLSVGAKAQADVLDIQGNIRDTETMKKLETVLVVVLQDGKAFDRFTTSGSGKYSLELPLGHDYTIEFSKETFVAKKINIKTKNIPEEDQRGGFQLAMDMSLFEYVEGFNTEILNAPIGKAGFDPQKNSINFDFGYTASIQEQIDAEFERLEDLAKNMEKMIKQFDELIMKGDQKMSDEKYADAVDKFQDAQDLIPNRDPAPEKLRLAQEKLDEFNALAEREREYLRLIDSGESKIKSKDYQAAKDDFGAASALKPDERLPKEKIKEIEDLMNSEEKRAQYDELVASGDKEFKAETYETAIGEYENALDLFPNEEYPRTQINDAKRILGDLEASKLAAEELEKQYSDLIVLGDRNFEAESYRDALRNYEQASALKKDEKHPKDRIAEINDLLAQLEADAATNAANDAARAEQERIDREFQAFVDAGNEAFDQDDLELAKQNYESALGVKQNEKYPKSRIDRINQMLADREMLADNKADEERKRREEREAADALADEERRLREQGLEEERQKRLAEEEELRRKKEADRLAEEEEERRRREQFNNNANSSTEDEAERYYREARESEARAKAKASEGEKNEHLNYLRAKENSAATTRKQNISDGDLMLETLQRIYRDGESAREYKIDESEQIKENSAGNLLAFNDDANYRRDANASSSEQIKKNSEALALNDSYRDSKVESSKDQKNENQSNLDSYSKQGNALRSSNEYDVKKNKEQMVATAVSGEDARLNDLETAEDLKGLNKSFNEDTQSAANERRAVSKDYTEKRKSESQNLGEGKEVYREENAHASERQKKDQAFLLESSSEEQKIRTYDTRKELFDKDFGSDKRPEDYILPEDAADLDEGVHERSYELGNKMIIERTVKRGNKVDTYRKVISKTGIYYFKNDVSSTEITWVRETLDAKD